MEEYIIKAINKYFRTLASVGYLKSKEAYRLFMVSTLYSMYKAFGPLFDKAGVEKLNKYVRCLTRKTCVFGKGVPCFSYYVEEPNSLITIIDSDVITTTNGETMVSTNNTTQRFTDFVVRTDIQPDQFLVGYDQSDNNELAISVNDLGLFWEVDL